MRLFQLVLALVTGLAAGPGLAVSAEPAASPQLSQRWWQDRFAEKQIEMHRQAVQLVFFGDSITHSFEWNADYARVWDHWYGGRKAVDLGFNSDKTADVIWRVRHGELDGTSPALAVILIGTNDLDKPPADTAAAIEQLAQDVRDRSPNTRILVLGILPSGKPEADQSAAQKVNRLLSAHFSQRGAIANYRDISCAFMREGRLDTSLFNEKPVPGRSSPIHPTPHGMDAFAAAIEPVVAGVLGEPIRKPLFTAKPVCQADPAG